MSSDVTIDAGGADRVRRPGRRRSRDGRGQYRQGREEGGSGRQGENPKRPEFQQQRRIARCSCEIRVGDHRLADISRDIGPEDSGKTREHGHTGPTVAAIAFYGTARGGGTHKPPEHYAEEELPTLAEYVGDAADDMLIGAIGLSSVMDMTSAVLGMIPGLDQPVYLNQEPDESEMPPWVIATCTTDGHRSTEAARAHGPRGTAGDPGRGPDGRTRSTSSAMTGSSPR